MFYPRGFFKHRALRFDLPGKIDEPFYKEIKERLAVDPRFKFDSDVKLWDLYKGLFILFLLTIIACVVLAVLIFTHNTNAVLVVVSVLVAFIGIRPSIYFGLLLFHFLKYQRDEKRFYSDFKKAIASSEHFPQFIDEFYRGRYSETTQLTVYHLTRPLGPIKDFVESCGLAGYMCIYKHAKGDDYLVLSNSVEVIRFIERQQGVDRLSSNDQVLQVVKQQDFYPFVYGNKRLKHLID
jgi:hypothetical protein